VSFRSPLTSLGEGVGQGLRDLAQTLIGAKQREQEIEEQRLRDEMQRTFNAEEAERGRQFQAQQADVTAGRNMGMGFLQQALETRANLSALAASGQDVPAERLAQLDEIIGGLQGAVATPFAEAGNIGSIIQGFGAPLATATGAAAAETTLLQQRQALQGENLNRFNAATDALLSPQMAANLSTSAGMASFVGNAARIRALASADMPSGTDTAQMVAWVEAMENMIAADPALSRLRDNELAASNIGRAMSEQAMLQAQIRTAIMSLEFTEGALKIEEAQEALAGVRAGNAQEAYRMFETTGLLLPGFEERVRSMYEASNAGTRGAPTFDQFREQRFKAYTERLDADRELLELKVRVGRNEATLSDYDVGAAEYRERYRDLDRFVAMQGSALELISAALAAGDVGNITRMLNALRDPQVDPRLNQYLNEAGVTEAYLNSMLTQAKGVRAFQDRSLEFARYELDQKFTLADIALRSAQRQDRAQPLVIAAQLQGIMAESMSPDQIAEYHSTLSPDQQALMGGPAGLAAAQSRARLRQRLETMNVTQGAMDFLRFLQTANIPDEQIGETAQSILRHLTDNGVDAGTATAIANGFAGNWMIGNNEEARAQAAHESQVALWNAQAAKLGIVDGPGGMGMDVGDVRQLLDSQRSALGERRQNLNTQALTMGCRGDTGGLGGLIQPPPNALPTSFNPMDYTPAQFSALTRGQQACVGVIRQLDVVDGELIELAGQFQNLANFMGLPVGSRVPEGGPLYSGEVDYGNPGSGGGHPLYTWDISMFRGENHTAVVAGFDSLVARGLLDPNNETEISEYLQFMARELDVWNDNGEQPAPSPGPQTQPTGDSGAAPAAPRVAVGGGEAAARAAALQAAGASMPAREPGEPNPFVEGARQALGEFGATAVLPSLARVASGEESGTGIGGLLTRVIDWGLRNRPMVPGLPGR